MSQLMGGMPPLGQRGEGGGGTASGPTFYIPSCACLYGGCLVSLWTHIPRGNAADKRLSELGVRV